jgi:hypothetical protein
VTTEALRDAYRTAKAMLRDEVVEPLDCEVCGERFTPTANVTARYCSNACRQRAYRQRRAG